jgi:hypothetical protein
MATLTILGVAAPWPPGFTVAEGGGATLQGYATLSSTFAGHYSLTPTPQQAGWSSVTVDRSAEDVLAVHAVAPSFELERRYIAASERVLINDTLTCAGGGSRCALYTNHTFTLLAAATVTLNGGFYAPQLGECQTAIVRGTNGNPSVVAARASGGGFGLMALDDVSRAHVSMVNRASPTHIPGFQPCAVTDPPTLEVLDTYLALSPSQRYTAEWALYAIDASVAPAEVPPARFELASPDPVPGLLIRRLIVRISLQVPWSFTTRLRADLGVNAVTLKGGATLASWQTDILAAGNWSAPGCMNGSQHGQEEVCFPSYDDETLEQFLRYQGTGLVVSNIMRMNHSWPRCEDNKTRDYCYGSCSTAREYSQHTDEYMRKLVGSLKGVSYQGKALLYLHPFISTETGAAEKFKHDRQLTADGEQTCDYRGEYVGTLTNAYGKQLLEFVSLAMDKYGFDGIYLDESSYGVTPLDFSPVRTDNHSAIIDPETLEITGHVSFVPLTWQGLHAAIYDEVVGKRRGMMVANSFPVTRTVMEAGIRNQVVQFVESSSKGRESWGHAYTPVALAKALFQLSDYDPRYANISGRPVDNLWADLDFGSLTYMYDMLLPNISGWEKLDNVMQHIFPTTPVELGPGWIVGRERIVSKVSRSFEWAGDALSLRIFGRQGFLTSKSAVKGPTISVALDGGERSFAVISAE